MKSGDKSGRRALSVTACGVAAIIFIVAGCAHNEPQSSSIATRENDLALVLRSGVGAAPSDALVWMPSAKPDLLDQSSAIYVLAGANHSVPPEGMRSFERSVVRAWHMDHGAEDGVPAVALSAAISDAASQTGNWPGPQAEQSLRRWADRQRSRSASVEEALAGDRLDQSLQDDEAVQGATGGECAPGDADAPTVIVARWRAGRPAARCVLTPQSAVRIARHVAQGTQQLATSSQEQREIVAAALMDWSAARYSLWKYPSLRDALQSMVAELGILAGEDRLERHPAVFRDYVALSRGMASQPRLGPDSVAVMREIAVTGSARDAWEGGKAFAYAVGALRLLGKGRPGDAIALTDPLETLEVQLMAAPEAIDARLVSSVASALASSKSVGNLEPRQVGLLARGVLWTRQTCVGDLGNILAAHAETLSLYDASTLAQSPTRALDALFVLKGAAACGITKGSLPLLPALTRQLDAQSQTFTSDLALASLRARTLCLVNPDHARASFDETRALRVFAAHDLTSGRPGPSTPADAFDEAFLIRVATRGCPPAFAGGPR